MVERDNAEEFIHDIVDEILGSTMDGIYKIYIERQLLPFTITQAKDAILQIIEVCTITQLCYCQCFVVT